MAARDQPLTLFVFVSYCAAYCCHSVLLLLLLLPGGEGNSGMLNVITQLGQRYELRAMMDSSSNLIGKIKHTSDNKRWGSRVEVTIAPEQNSCKIGTDYKGNNYTSQLAFNFQELTASFSQSLTPAVIAGVEVTHLLGQATALAAQLQHSNDTRGEKAAITYKHQGIHASFFKQVSDTTTIATDLQWVGHNKESLFQVGVTHRRPGSYTYQASVMSTYTVLCTLEVPIVPGISFSLCGAMNQDGSNEAQFGFGLTIG